MNVSSSCLDLLPLEFLKLILKFLGGENFGALWLCGSSLLNWKLSKGGVVTDLCLELDNFARLQWPPMLANFPKLVTITISEASSNRLYNITSQQLLSLPPTMTSISILLHGITPAFHEVFETNPSQFQRLEHLSIGSSTFDVRSQKLRVSKCLLDSNVPRGLLTLVVEDPLEPWHFSMDTFPPQLRKLQLYAPAGFHNPCDGFKLQPSITDFSVTRPDQEQEVDWLSILSEGLLTLKIPIYIGIEVEYAKSKLDLIPRSVTELEMTVHTVRGLALTSLPPTLLSLSIYCWDTHVDDISPYLPPRLTFLDAPIGPSVTKPIAQRLPRSITKCCLYIVHPDTLEALPCALFSHYTGHSTEPKSLYRIPHGLKSLTLVSKPAAASCHFLRQVPTLTSVVFQDSELNSEVIQAIPKCVRSVIIVFATAEKIPDPSIFSALPPDLAIFTCASLGSPSEVPIDLSCLPRSLLSLSASEPAQGLTSGWFGNLPSSLTSLQYFFTGVPSTEVFAQISTTCPSLRSMSITIQRRLRGPREEDSYARFLEYLPRLHELEVSFDSSFKARIERRTLLKFPRSLRFLRLVHVEIEGKNSEDLPPHLHSFTLNHRIPAWYQYDDPLDF